MHQALLDAAPSVKSHLTLPDAMSATVKDYPAIGAALRAARERRGWSQAQLGRRLGMTGANVSLIEQGRTRPPLDALTAHASALGLVLDVTLLDPEDGTVDLLRRIAEVLPHLSPSARETLEAWARLGAEVSNRSA